MVNTAKSAATHFSALNFQPAPPSMMDRQAFIDELGAAIREAAGAGESVALILVDINGFAEINASWGMAAGDELLKAFGDRLAGLVEHLFESTGSGEAAKAARLDGDHFAVLVPQIVGSAVLAAARELIGGLAAPFVDSGQSISLTARAAVLLAPQHARSPSSLLGRGFRMLNSAARTASGGVATASAESGKHVSALFSERDLGVALSTDQIFVALQPKVDLATGAICGAEALARWRHPEQGLLPPLEFVDVAERSGLIFELGLRVLSDTCRVAQTLSRGGRALKLAVNVSPLQITHPHFLSRFLEIVDKAGIEPHALEIEITETAAMTGGERFVESLRALRRCGISVAIDDFGTGFSNLAALSALAADTLKIDRSLVAGPELGTKGVALLRIAVQLGKALGMATVAEGVETGEQYRRVAEFGCDMVQGYHTGRPVAADEFARHYL